MCLAFVAAYFALAAEIKRRKLNLDAYSIVAYVAIAGILGAKLWHVIDTPSDRPTLDLLLSSQVIAWLRGGFAWFGGFVAGIATLVLLARSYRISWRTMLDVASPAAAIGYAVGRIGCLISGDGDYGKPTSLPWGMAFPHGLVPTSGSGGTCVQWGWPERCRVHPTPIYASSSRLFIFWYPWPRAQPP